MEDKAKNYEEYKEPINYIASVFGAIGGAAIGAAIWAGATYFTKGSDGSYSFYYITPVLVGILAGTGATRLGGGNNLMTALIALIFGAIGVVLGDALETAAIEGNFNLSIQDYIDAAMFKFDELPIRYATHGIAILAAFFTGLIDGKKDS
jgi:uncharacterized membrane protein YeaQ/YmgE (transglycosylase-associated protein family)